jgi:hypothetical protein
MLGEVDTPTEVSSLSMLVGMPMVLPVVADAMGDITFINDDGDTSEGC